MSKYSLFIAAIAFTNLTSCNSNAIFEDNTAIPDRSWNYSFKPSYKVKVEDKNAKYDVYINLRHTNEYDYSNVYILLNEKGKNVKDTSYRKEIPLAALDGKWYGKSAGSLYEIQYLAKENVIFPDTGIYTFQVEQNMRDNPLKDISDVGIKVIKK